MRQLLAFGLLALFLTFGACSTAGTDCGPFEDKFKTTDFSTEVFRATFDTVQVEPNLSPIEGDTLEEGSYAVRMVPEKMLYSTRSKASTSFQIINSAYACSPPIPTSDEVIKDIRIYSDKRFKDDYPAGEDLSGLFDAVVLNRADFGGYRRFELTNFLEKEPNAVDELILILVAKPETTSSFQFTVEYEQDGKGLERFEFETDPVVLKPN